MICNEYVEGLNKNVRPNKNRAFFFLRNVTTKEFSSAQFH